MVQAKLDEGWREAQAHLAWLDQQLEGLEFVAEAQAEDIVTLPGHQYLTNSEVDYMIDRVRRFYGR